jgi:serine/threonine protein kinase
MQHVYHPDDTLDGYHIVEHVADGAYAAVYRAVPVEKTDPVVLKIPHPFVLDRAASAARWRREVALTAQLDYPNIQRQLYADVPRSYPYLVLEYASRGSLGSWVRTKGPVPWQQALPWGVQLAEVLACGYGEKHEQCRHINDVLHDCPPRLLAKKGL